MSRSQRRPAHRIAAIASTLVLAAVAPATAQTQFPAALAGHAILPAATFVAAPSDAPDSLKLSGKYTTADGRRRDAPGSVPGTSFLSDRAAPRPTGMSLPFAAGQPVQGFSGIKTAKDGTFWVLTDNGFGNKRNSPDAMLMFHRVRVDWTRGAVDRLETIFLSDPDRVVPFHVVNEATSQRHLTGSDLDIESMQPIGDAFYFGDEFGPYVIRTDRTGKVTGFWETTLDGKVLRSPDHFAVATPATPGPFVVPMRRSRGYEGMAASPDGRFLYPMLEGSTAFNIPDSAGTTRSRERGPGVPVRATVSIEGSRVEVDLTDNLDCLPPSGLTRGFFLPLPRRERGARSAAAVGATARRSSRRPNPVIGCVTPSARRDAQIVDWLDVTTGFPVRASMAATASTERHAVHEQSSASASGRHAREAKSTTDSGP